MNISGRGFMRISLAKRGKLKNGNQQGSGKREKSKI